MISETDVNKFDDVFRLKHFDVYHGSSTMKVGTDAFIVGSWLKTDPVCRRILDVGTGCGIIALMLAQRSTARIDAIDIDEPSIEEAKSNFNNSPWNSRLHAIHASIRDFNPDEKYDLIVSNPPFFRNSILPASARFRLAKHTTTFPLEDFVNKSKSLLMPGGKLAVILPDDVAVEFSNLAEDSGFNHSELLKIIPKEGKPVNRVVLVYLLNELANAIVESLVIRDVSGQYTPAYKLLTEDFHAEGYI